MDDRTPEHSGNARSEDRQAVGIPGRYRRGAGVPSDVQLLDLSKSGCRFYDRFGSLKTGTELTIRIGTIGPIVAIVRWRKDTYVGVSFEPPLHDAIYDHICASDA